MRPELGIREDGAAGAELLACPECDLLQRAVELPPRAAAMARALHRRGVLTKLRYSAGQDVDAGCGQLRARLGDGDAAPRIAIRAA